MLEELLSMFFFAACSLSPASACDAVHLRCAGESSKWGRKYSCEESLDNDIDNWGWWAREDSNTCQWLMYKPAAPITVSKVYLYGDDLQGTANWAPKRMLLQACPDAACSQPVTAAEYEVERCLFWQRFDCDAGCQENITSTTFVRLYFPSGHNSTIGIREIKVCSADCPSCFNPWVGCQATDAETTLACSNKCGASCSCGCDADMNYMATCSWTGDAQPPQTASAVCNPLIASFSVATVATPFATLLVSVLSHLLQLMQVVG